MNAAMIAKRALLGRDTISAVSYVPFSRQARSHSLVECGRGRGRGDR